MGYRAVNLLKLSFFNENLAKMLADGLMFKDAFDVASKGLGSATNRRLMVDLRKVFLGENDVYQTLGYYRLPRFYLALLECGQRTGNLPEALRASGSFIRQITPLTYRLVRCWQFAIEACLISLILRWIVLGQLQWLGFVLLTIVFVLPVCSETFRYYRDLVIVKLPFIGVWEKQLALLEFFVCLEIAYDSTLNVHEMFSASISAIDNRYLRKQMGSSVEVIEKGHTFAAALQAVSFVPGGIAAVVHTDEISGKMATCFHELVAQLKKIVEAKLEVLKFFSVGITIDFGVLFPLVLILPLFVSGDMLLVLNMFLLGLMGYVPIACARGAFYQYSEKSAGLNLWYKQLENKNLDI